jgi:hypothetical protein
VVSELLRSLGYSLQANRKTREGGNHPDHDAQFTYINEQVKAALATGEPAISVDTVFPACKKDAPQCRPSMGQKLCRISRVFHALADQKAHR